MTAEDLLKKAGTRMTFYDRWLIWDCKNWVVYERLYRARTSTCVVETEDFEEAAKALTKNEV